MVSEYTLSEQAGQLLGANSSVKIEKLPLVSVQPRQKCQTFIIFMLTHKTYICIGYIYILFGFKFYSIYNEVVHIN